MAVMLAGTAVTGESGDAAADTVYGAPSGDIDGVHWEYNESGDTLTITKKADGDGRISDWA